MNISKEMKIIEIPIEMAFLAPYNPRRMSEAVMKKLEQSIRTHGYVDPLIWNRASKHVVGGNQRLEILRRLGFKKIKVVEVDLTYEEEVSLNLALNKIKGDFIDEKVAALYLDLKKLPNFEAVTGFEDYEVERLFEHYCAPEEEDDFNVEGELSKIDQAITQPGDIIELGNHRILCGDATATESVSALMAGRQASIVITDPPYSVNYCAEQRPTNKRKKPKWAPITNDNLSEVDYHSLLEKSFSNMHAHLVPGGAVYVWNGFAQFGRMHDLLTKLDFHISSVITWAKPNPSPSFSDYQWQTEFCLYGWSNKGPHKWFGQNHSPNLWSCGRDAATEIQHPSQKPIELSVRALRNSSERGNIVLDMFLGSASVLIAAERLGRICYGIEISQAYCDLAVKRFAKSVGHKSLSAEIKEKYL